MPRSQGFETANNFTKGLITEASSLTFPKDACTETFNCVHNLDGSVSRRNAFRVEINNSTRQITRDEGVVSTYFWKDVSGDGNLILVVLQVKDHLYFYNADTTDPYVGAPSNPLSANPISATIDLTAFSPSGAPNPGTEECQFTSGNGKLFVAHPYLEPFAVSFDTNTQTFTTTQITIKVRDFEGLDDGLEILDRPQVGLGGVTIAHHYNLLNQGWNATNLNTWDANRTDLPSNSDVMWTFKNSSNVFDTSTVDNVVAGNSPAAKGHFILDAFNKQRDEASGLIINDETTDFQRPSTIAFYSGRLFYAGTNYEGYNSKIFFSPIIERDEQFGECYQINDPTAEDLSDLLPSDGGVIEIQEAGTVIKLISVPGGLAVFSSNGVWLITGSTGLGFTATDYTQSKLASINAITATSFVDLAGTPVWWNLEGIYRLAQTGNGNLQVSSITDTTIKTFYDTIPPSEKRNARGFYNPIEQIAQWLFRSTEAGDLDTYYDYDRVFNLDLRTGGIYIWTIPEHAITVHGMVVLENRGGNAMLEDMTFNNGSTVTNNALETIQTWTIGDSIVIPKFKYVISYESGGNTYFTFADVTDDMNYQDWYDFTPADYDSYFISGYSLQNGINYFQSNYIAVFVDDNTKLDIQGIWDFTNSGNSGRWTQPQRIDSTSSLYTDYNIFRRKIRGRGRAIQIKVKSVSGQPFRISGWAAQISSNTTP